MTNKPSPTPLIDRFVQSAKGFLTVTHEEPLWARRGEILMVLSTMALISIGVFMVFIMLPTVIINRAFDLAYNLFWVYCLIFIVGLIGVAWLAKQSMVREGAILFLFMSISTLLAMNVTAGYEVWVHSAHLGLLIMIALAGGLLGRSAALITSVVVTMLEAALISFYHPNLGYDILVDAAWYNLSLGGLMWGMLKPLEELADHVNPNAKVSVMDHDHETKIRTHSEIVAHLHEHSKQSFGLLKMHIKTLSDDENLSPASREALEEIRLHMSRVQHASDEMLDYIMLTQPGMPAPTLEDYRPPEMIMGIQRYFLNLGIEVDLLTNGMPRTVHGMPAATRRALTRMGEYALRITSSNYLRMDARIEGQKGWRVRFTARFTEPPASLSAVPVDPITVIATKTLRALGGNVEFIPTHEEMVVAVILPFKMNTPNRRLTH